MRLNFREHFVEESFANDLLNSLSAHIAVLDKHGSIVAVNDAWKRFTRENGGDRTFYLGANYVAACGEAERSGDIIAGAVVDGLRDLLCGRQGRFSIEYPCHSPNAQRWFMVQGSRFSHKGEAYVVTVHEDITARKLAEHALSETETTLRSVLEALPVGVWILNQQGQIVHGNSASQRIWAGARYVGPEYFGEYKGWWLSTGRPIAADEWAAARAIQKGETSIDEEVRIQCFDGASKIILNSAIPLRDHAGQVSGAIIVNQDITARKHVEEQLRVASAAVDAVNRDLQQVLAHERSRAGTDDLTGLSNRRHFFEVSQQLFAVAQRYQTPLSVVMVDLDHFKRINDLYGHQAGDVVLAHVARIAREHTRGSDVLGRYGGEELVLTLPNTGAHEARAAAENIRTAVATRPAMAGEQEVSVTISAGVAEIAEDVTLDHLIQRADQALYAAKNAGRNCSRVSSPSRTIRRVSPAVRRREG